MIAIVCFSVCQCDSSFSTGDCEDGTGRCICRPEFAGDDCQRFVGFFYKKIISSDQNKNIEQGSISIAGQHVEVRLGVLGHGVNTFKCKKKTFLIFHWWTSRDENPCLLDYQLTSPISAILFDDCIHWTHNCKILSSSAQNLIVYKKSRTTHDFDH